VWLQKYCHIFEESPNSHEMINNLRILSAQFNCVRKVPQKQNFFFFLRIKGAIMGLFCEKCLR